MVLCHCFNSQTIKAANFKTYYIDAYDDKKKVLDIGLEDEEECNRMAAKDDHGNLTKVPGLQIENGVQLRRFCEGKLLKEFSKKKRLILRSDLEDVSNEQMYSMYVGENCNIVLPL